MPTRTNIIKAACCAVILNAFLFGLGAVSGVISDDVLLPNVGKPLTLTPVLTASLLPVPIAALLLFMLSKWVQTPHRIFNGVSVMVLLLSFLPPFFIPKVSFAMAVLLNLMHIVVAGSVIYFFQRGANQPNPSA